MRLIAQGATSKVYDNGDGTVTKIASASEREPLPGLDLPEMEYVAKCLSKQLNGPHIFILKEKIGRWDLLKFEIGHIAKHWDGSLINSKDLFDFINDYLQGPDKQFCELRSCKKFKDYLYCTLGKPESMVNKFEQLCHLVQELKDVGVYAVDWNEENFGVKNNHIALFELGGAKVKRR